MPSEDTELRNRVAAIRRSGLFDEAAYKFRMEAALKRQDPVLHYLTAGEARSAPPSRLFDPAYYKKKYKIGGDSPLVHYIVCGRNMGLAPLPIAARFTFDIRGLRDGYKRFILVASARPSLADPARRLLSALRDDVDVVVVLLDAPYSPQLAAEAAGLVFPSEPLKPGWDVETIEAAYLASGIMDRIRPTAVICCGLRGLHIVEQFLARFIPTVALVLEEAQPGNEKAHRKLFSRSAAIHFATDEIAAQHMELVPWLASRRMAVSPLLSPRSEDAGAAASMLRSALAEAEQTLSEMEARYQRILISDLPRSKLAKNLFGGHGFDRRLLMACAVGGLATGLAPAFPTPRLLMGFDYSAYTRERGTSNGDPVINYLLDGQFDRFLRKVICPEDDSAPPPGFRAALHGHYYYTDIADELFRAVSLNKHPIDLYLSTDTEDKAMELAACAARHGRKADIRVFPNRGRDLGPFLTGFRDILDAGYDIVGHVHGKKTPQERGEYGNEWRQTLLDRTIGMKKAMADAIISAFAADRKLGLAFPATANTLNWDKNLNSAARLVRAMKIEHVLTVPSFDYAAGSFFWCRPAALKPMLELGLDWNDYPDEPISSDGTMLHAIERLLTFVCEASGFVHAVTHVAEAER